MEKISRAWRHRRHFVAISPRREHQAREALCGHFPQCEITARSHGAGERACTHGGAFDRAESGVLRASLRKLITLNLRYRSIGRTDRPTDRGRVVKRKSDIFGDASRYCRAHAIRPEWNARLCLRLRPRNSVRFWHDDLAVALCAPSRNRESLAWWNLAFRFGELDET